MEQNLEKTKYLRNLRRKIQEHFSMGELKVLCLDVMVDYDELAGEEKVEKIANLITHLARRGRLSDLVQLLKEERPKVNWEESIPPIEQQIEDAEKLVPAAKDDLILREYFEKLNQFLPPDALTKAKTDPHLRTTIHGLTVTYMQQLDLYHRTALVRRLSEQSLLKIVSLAQVNLRGADLSGANLQGVDLEDAELVGAFLARSNLQNANLRGIHLERAFLQEADLRKANLESAVFFETVFSMADLRDANLKNISLDYAKYFFGATINDFEILERRAEIELENGLFQSAFADCEQLCEHDPQNDWYYFLRGLSNLALGHEEIAKRDLQKALEYPERKKYLHLVYHLIFARKRANRGGFYSI